MSSSADLGAQNGANPPAFAPCATDQTAPASLDPERLLKRRATAIEELYRAYKADFLSVIDDLNDSYQEFTRETGRTGWREDLAAVRVSKPPLSSSLVQEVRKMAEGQGGVPPAALPTSFPQSQMGEAKPDEGLPRIATLEGRADLDAPIPRFGQLEKFMLSHQPTTSSQPTPASKSESILKENVAAIARLECLASSATARKLDNGVAVLIGEKGKYLISRPAVSLGRGGSISGNVDVDLSLEGAGAKVSRHQAHLWVDSEGKFYLKCIGRRPMFVNGRRVVQGKTVECCHLSLIEVGTVRLLFMVNQMAVDRMIEATKKRLNT
ncbi:hypothetical protein BSKO_00970 [Bryopsis sp. KO-2023]|nr:hypothetical protein BSKO_00970 [Bryopsis sp. KO-2023]